MHLLTPLYHPRARRYILALIALGIAGLGYHDADRIEVTTLKLDIPAWPVGQQLKIVVLADIHAKPNSGDYLDKIVQLTLEQKPDLILHLGDILDGRTEEEAMSLQQLKQRLQPLSDIPQYAIFGNHDHAVNASGLAKIFKELDIRILHGKTASLDFGSGRKLHLGGLRCIFTYGGNPGRIPSIPEEAKKNKEPFIMISHAASGARFVDKESLITLAGHSHGGQICLPFGIPILNSDIYAPREWIKGYVAAGKDHSAIYTSRGLGTSIIPLRIFCRPEILLLELQGQ